MVQQAAQNLGAAAWAGHEFQDAAYLWPRAFSDLGEEYDRRFGLKYEHLMRIAEINFANGRKNPNAQTRQWAFNAKSLPPCQHTDVFAVPRFIPATLGSSVYGLRYAPKSAFRAARSARNLPVRT